MNQTIVIKKNVLLNWHFLTKKKFRKIQMIFDIENWLWKSNFGTFWQLAIMETIRYDIMKVISGNLSLTLLLFFEVFFFSFFMFTYMWFWIPKVKGFSIKTLPEIIGPNRNSAFPNFCWFTVSIHPHVPNNKWKFELMKLFPWFEQ